VTNNPQWASEASPAEFDISGAVAGATCTATETSVASGYTKNESDCQNRDLVNGSCTIVNTLGVPGPEEMIDESGFEDGNASGWSLNGSVTIDGILAIGQYSLRHMKGSSSERGISTVGYDGVSVKMHLAGSSLKRKEVCHAEVSTNGGNTWSTVVEIDGTTDTGSFHSGMVSPSGADDNPDLRLRFRYAGKGKGGYCYGDNVIVTGTPIGN
jgi:hypothetical protein